MVFMKLTHFIHTSVNNSWLCGIFEELETRLNKQQHHRHWSLQKVQGRTGPGPESMRTWLHPQAVLWDMPVGNPVFFFSYACHEP